VVDGAKVDHANHSLSQSHYKGTSAGCVCRTSETLIIRENILHTIEVL